MEVIKQAIVREKLITSTTKRVASNFLWSIVSEAIAKGIFFITNIYLARTLGVSNFGIFILAQTITFYLWLVVDLGIGMYSIREIAKNKEKAEHIINPLLTLRILSGALFFFLYVIVLFFIDISLQKKLAFIGCGVYLLSYSFYSDWIFKGFEKFKFIALGSLVSSTLLMAGVLYLVRSGDDLIKATFIWSLSFFFGSVSLLYFSRRTLGIRFRLSFDIKTWLLHVRESIFFTLSIGLLAISQYLPVLLLGIFFTPFEVGLFSAPHKLISSVEGAGFIVTMSFYPVLSEQYNKYRTKFGKTHKNFQKIMLLSGIPVGTLIALFGKEITVLMFGSQYLQSAGALKLLSLHIPLYFLRTTFGIALLAAGYQRLFNIITFLGAICAAFMGLLLIPKFSIIGGAVSLLLSEIIILGLMGLAFYKRTK